MNDAIKKLPIRFRFACQADVFHEVWAALTDKAKQLLVENLPLLYKDKSNIDVLKNLQLATSMSSICQMQAMHAVLALEET